MVKKDEEGVILPRWVTSLPPGDRRNRAINRFYIRLAALYATEAGTLADLAVLIGINCCTLRNQAISKVRASAKTVEGIRRLLGEQFVPPRLPILRYGRPERINGSDSASPPL